MSTDLLFTPAVKAAAMIRARKLSPVEYLDAVLKAADTANPQLNCFRVVMAEEARRDAKKAEEAVMRGDTLGPLHGVPVSIKDLVDVKGVPTRHGSAIFDGNPPAAADDIIVRRLREAASRATPGTSSARRVARAAAARPRSPQASVRSRSAPMARARCADPRRARDWLASSRHSASCPTTPRAMPSATTSMPAP